MTREALSLREIALLRRNIRARIGGHRLERVDGVLCRGAVVGRKLRR